MTKKKLTSNEVIIKSAKDLGHFLKTHRTSQKLTQADIAGLPFKPAYGVMNCSIFFMINRSVLGQIWGRLMSF